MPTYQYACRECGHSFEQVQSFSEDSLTVCPVCQGSLRKVFNAVGVVFKGSGFYRNDSRSGGSGSGEKSSSDTGSSEKSGSDKGSEKKDSGKSGSGEKLAPATKSTETKSSSSSAGSSTSSSTSSSSSS